MWFKRKQKQNTSLEIKLKARNGKYIITLKSRVTLNLVVDTGATSTLVGNFSAHKCLYQQTGNYISANGVGGTVKAEVVQLTLSTKDGLYSKTLPAATISSDEGTGYTLRSSCTDGILGMDFLDGCIIDFSKSVLTIPSIKS